MLPPIARQETVMPHAIIRGANGRRHEVNFGDAPVRVEIYPSEETVEIFIEADFETLPEERRRFALLNIPRHLFRKATAAAARRGIEGLIINCGAVIVPQRWLPALERVGPQRGCHRGGNDLRTGPCLSQTGPILMERSTSP